MNKETASKIINYINKEIEKNSFDSFFITLFGGEPFTDFNSITYPLLSKIKTLIEKAGKYFSCFFVTNASLIDEEIINKLKYLNPHLQITLDGDKEHHDKVRIWKQGNKPTYDHILWVIRRTRQTLWRGGADANPKTCCQTIHDCQKVVPLHYESEWQYKHV